MGEREIKWKVVYVMGMDFEIPPEGLATITSIIYC
jgi:hypothetical protein